MNAHNSFRTSITILTFATLAGCVVVLFSGLSLFGLRPATDDKALVSTADQKLRNRFGEFYPAEPRVSTTVTRSHSPNAIQTVSQRSEIDQETTTTSDHGYAEVITSWTSSPSTGTPQVSVPVTINVNNGELMTQLIETRESLAEIKARQSDIRQEQRVFSYEVHKKGKDVSKSVDAAAASTADPEVQSVKEGSSSPEPDDSVEPATGTSELSGKQASRIRPAAADSSSRRIKSDASQTKLPPAGLKVTDTTPPTKKNSTTTTNLSGNVSETVEFETITETKSTSAAETTEFRIEEEISFEEMTPPQTPSTAEDQNDSVPVIEPISYDVEEFETSSTDASEEPVVQFAPLDEVDETAMPAEVPKTLPELSFQPSQSSPSTDLPTLSIQNQSTDTEAFKVSTKDALNEKASTEPSLPDFADATESSASATQGTEGNSTSPSKATDGSRRKREELAAAFSAVRGLPPEDLFGTKTTPRALALPSTNETAPGHDAAPKSISVAESDTAATTSETELPTISFIESTDDRLVVHSVSAASPVDLEFGAPSAAEPALAGSEAPGRPDAPVMPPADDQPERWHKYRSRIHRSRTSSPSTPVPPAPKIAQSDVARSSTASSQEPARVPPASENTLADTGAENRSPDNSISDSPLLIPDTDGATEVAQNQDSEKLSSSALPPVPELADIPSSQAETSSNEATADPVYVPQPSMDRLSEVETEWNTTPIVSSPPSATAPRKTPKMPTGSTPFATTIRRINKRVANIADAIRLPERKIAQHKPAPPKAPTIRRPQPSPPKLSQREGHTVEKKISPPAMRLPKLTVPKFTVQNFSLPSANFRSMPAPSLRMPALDTPDWLACPPDFLAPARNSTAVHRMISTMQFVGQPRVLN